MKIKRKQGIRIDLAESGVLSDLAFLLIIFFIVIAVFNINMGFLLELPGKDSSRIVSVDDLVKVKLSGGNKIIHNGAVITVDEVEKIIADVRKSHPNMTFALLINPDARYQNVVEIVELARKMKIENFSFAMEKTEK